MDIVRAMRRKNTRTSTLLKYIDATKVRLTERDREFFRDLAKVQLIDRRDALNHHYQSANSTKRLDKLCEYGILDKIDVNQPGRGKFKAYQFKTDKIASLFGGKRATIGSKRNALHEVITSKIYFAEGRPESFVVESNFTKEQNKMFKLNSPSLTKRNSSIPDAMYVNSGGEIVVCEADSGQYNQTQIRSKQAAWRGFKQVWGQPAKAGARVNHSKVHHFI